MVDFFFQNVLNGKETKEQLGLDKFHEDLLIIFVLSFARGIVFFKYKIQGALYTGSHKYQNVLWPHLQKLPTNNLYRNSESFSINPVALYKQYHLV